MAAEHQKGEKKNSYAKELPIYFFFASNVIHTRGKTQEDHTRKRGTQLQEKANEDGSTRLRRNEEKKKKHQKSSPATM
jgi:hypothetical protein